MNLQPGDVFFTREPGVVGWIIRHGSGAHYAHCGIVHEVLEETKDGTLVRTVEARPSGARLKDGVRWRTRLIPDLPPHRTHEFAVVRPTNDTAQQSVLLATSASMAEREVRYGWDSIVRIALRGLGVRVPGSDTSERAICSEHVSMALVAACPSLEASLPVPPHMVWPGVLHAVLTQQPLV